MTRDEWQRAEPVLTHALLLPDREREALLQTVDLEDALRRDIMEMFRRSPAGSASLAAVGHLPTPPASAHTPLPALPALAPGSSLANGRYVVVRQIGRGGMGAVFLGHDTMFGTLVALKAVPYDERLLAEARRAAVCSDHPHVATIHNVLQEKVGDHDLGVLVMEYVAGTPASQLLDEGPVDVRRVLTWGRQIAAAVAHAHEHQVLHCDLKPENIVITADGRAKVLDFGISRATFDAGDSKEPVRGTMPYMAPEQLLSKQFLPAGDIYSLGVTLFELVTGRLPFEGDDDLLRLRIVGAPPPDASDLNADVPPELQKILERAMAKQPEKRFRSARSFERALAALEAGIHYTTDTIPVARPAAAASPSPGLGSRVAVGTLTCVALLTLLGFIASRALDGGLGRTAEYRVESPLWWPIHGAMSLTAPLVGVVAPALVLSALVTGLCRFLSSTAVGRWCEPLTGRIRVWTAKASQLPPRTIGQFLLVGQLATLTAVLAIFRDEIEVVFTFMDPGSKASLHDLRPSNASPHEWYRASLSAQLFLFVTGWWLLARRRLRDAVAALAAGAAVTLVSLFFLTLPFRIVTQNEHQRASYAGDTCYITAQRGVKVLIFCPLVVPRTRVVDADDEALEPSTVIEDIFSVLDLPSSSPAGD